MRDEIIGKIARATIYPYNKAKYSQYQRKLADAPRISEQRLLELLRRTEDTRFGRDFHLAGIDSISAFRQRLPICDFSDMLPYVEAVANGDKSALFPASERIMGFSCTSGTTGKPKMLPITRHWLSTYQRHWRIWGIKALMDHPGVLYKKWLQISGSARMAQTLSGHDAGAISAITARYQNPLVQYGFAAPHEIGDIHDSHARHYALLRLAIVHPVGFIITITAANLIKLAELADEVKLTLIRDIHDGTMTGGGDDSKLHAPRLRKLAQVRNPERARELERIVSRTGTLYPKDFWQLELISCWTGGTVGYQARNLRKYYGDTAVRDVGYISTEGRHTVPIDDATPNGLLVADGAFYEFIPEGGGDVRCAHELDVGQTYEVAVTTENGVFRCRLGDVVRCNGFEGPSPIIEFLCKTQQYADLEGEKISGYQIARAMTIASQQLQLPTVNFCAVPIRLEQDGSYYAFVVEPMGSADAAMERKFLGIVDKELGDMNFLYAYKRDDQSLGPPRLLFTAPGTFAARTKRDVARSGAGETQYKQPALLEQSQLSDFNILRTVEMHKPARDGSGAAA